MSTKRRGEGSLRRNADGTFSVKYKGWHPEKGMTGQYWRRTNETTKGAALDRRAQFLAESRDRKRAVITAPRVPGTKADLKASELYAFYLDRRGLGLGVTLEPFEAFFVEQLGNPRWSEVAANPQWLRAYVETLKASGRKAATIRNIIRMTNAIVRFAADSYELDRAYEAATKISVKVAFPDGIPPNPYRPWQEWEYPLFISHLPFWMAQVLRVGWLTGWRLRQIERLKMGSPPAGWANLRDKDQLHGWLDTSTQTSWPHKQKSGQQIRVEYLKYSALATVIADQLAWRHKQGFDVTDPTGFVFRRPSTYTKGIALGDCRRYWDAAIKACKEDRPDFGKDDPRFRPGMTFHGLRSTAITRLRSSGMRPKVIALLTGHTSDEIVHSYDRASHAELYGGLESVHAERVDRGS